MTEGMDFTVEQFEAVLEDARQMGLAGEFHTGVDFDPIFNDLETRHGSLPDSYADPMSQEIKRYYRLGLHETQRIYVGLLFDLTAERQLIAVLDADADVRAWLLSHVAKRIVLEDPQIGYTNFGIERRDGSHVVIRAESRLVEQ